MEFLASRLLHPFCNHPNLLIYFSNLNPILRWAAKEAAYKAFATQRIPFPEIYVGKNEYSGRPELMFEGGAAEYAEAEGVGRSFVSLSHDGDYALAQVMLECAVPVEQVRA